MLKLMNLGRSFPAARFSAQFVMEDVYMLPLLTLLCSLLGCLSLQSADEESVDAFSSGFNKTSAIIVPGIIAGYPANCLLDSGATISAVDLEFATKFAKVRHGPDVNVGTPSEVVKNRTYVDIERSFLDFPKQTGVINVCDMSNFQADSGYRVDAFIGMDYLRSCVFQFQSGKPRFIPRAKFSSDPAARSHRLRRHAPTSHTTAAIDLKVLGQREFMIDTGFNGPMSISSAWIKRLVKAGEAVETPHDLVAVDGSGIRNKSLYIIREVQIWGIKMQNVPAVESELNLIGLEIMRHLDFSVDFENSNAYVLPSSRSVELFDVDASGLRPVFHRDMGLIVRHIVPDSPAEKNKIQTADQLLEIDGRATSDLAYWEIRSLLSQAGKTISLKVKSGDQVRDIQLPLRRSFEYPPKWKPRSTDAEDFLKSLENEARP